MPCGPWMHRFGREFRHCVAYRLGRWTIEESIAAAAPRWAEAQPLGKEAAAYFQSQVDAIYSNFKADVARGRGITSAEVETRFGQGRCVTPLGKACAERGDHARIDERAPRLALVSHDEVNGEHGKDRQRDRRKSVFDQHEGDRAKPAGSAGGSGASSRSATSSLVSVRRRSISNSSNPSRPRSTPSGVAVRSRGRLRDSCKGPLRPRTGMGGRGLRARAGRA